MAANDKTCIDAIEQAHANGRAVGASVTANDEGVIGQYFRQNFPSDTSCQINVFQTAWFNTSLLLEGRRKGIMRWGLSILPTFSIGVPLHVFGDAASPAYASLNSVKTVGGVSARVTPLGYLASADFFLGTADAGRAANLDPATYKSPTFILGGVGIDAFGGALSLSIVYAGLRTDGLFSKQGDHATFLQFGIDLGAILISAGGAAQAGPR